jgi:hypothetical protein
MPIPDLTVCEHASNGSGNAPDVKLPISNDSYDMSHTIEWVRKVGWLLETNMEAQSAAAVPAV